jgi:excisionase family DNA binding protein
VAQQQHLLNPIPAVCERLNIGRTVVYREIAAGRLRSVKVGARRLVSEGALTEYVALLEQEAV